MKWIEGAIRKFFFFLLRIFLRNKQVALPLDTAKVKKILLLRQDVLGDMIVTTPTFNLIKEQNPNIEIHVLCSKRNIGLLSSDSRISKTYCYDKTIKSLLRVRREAQGENYDCIFPLVFNKSTNAGLWANWMGGRKPIKIGRTNPWRMELYKSLFNAQVSSEPNSKDAMTMSEIIVYFFCKSFGWTFSKDLVKLSVELSSENEKYAHDYFMQFHGRKTVLINISAGKVGRAMPEETVSKLLLMIISTYPRVVILLNATHDDIEKAERLCSKFPGTVIILPFSSDVLNFCALVKSCNAVISPDTATVHIAATFNIPLVGIYKNIESNYKEWGPQHKKAVLVLSEGNNEVSSIKPEKVFNAFNELNKRFEIFETEPSV